MLKLRAGLLMGVAFGLGLAAIGAPAAHAHEATSVLLSDFARFTATATPAATPGFYNFTSSSCSVVSEDERKAFSCHLKGQFSPTPLRMQDRESLVSFDGGTDGEATFTRTATNTYLMKGSSEEFDAGGGRASANLGGKWTAVPNTTGGYNITGTVVVSDQS